MIRPILAAAVALLPTLAQAETYICDVTNVPAVLSLEIDRTTGLCRASGTRLEFVSSDGDFVCYFPQLAWTLLVAPDNSWAMFDSESDVLYSGRCTPL